MAFNVVGRWNERRRDAQAGIESVELNESEEALFKQSKDEFMNRGPGFEWRKKFTQTV